MNDALVGEGEAAEGAGLEKERRKNKNQICSERKNNRFFSKKMRAKLTTGPELVLHSGICRLHSDEQYPHSPGM